MADQDLKITLSLNDQASDQATAAFSKMSSTATASASQASAAYNSLGNAATDSGNKQEGSFIKTKGSFDHLLLTVGSLIIAYNALSKSFADVAKVGADMDPQINSAFENFNDSVTKVQAELALKLKPEIITVTSFWTDFLNKLNMGGQSTVVADMLDNDKQKLADLQQQLSDYTNVFKLSTAADVTAAEAVTLKIRAITQEIQFYQQLVDSKNKSNTAEVTEYTQLQKSTQALKDFATEQKNNQTLFLLGQTSAANYYKQLTTGEAQANQDLATRQKSLKQTADLENEANDSTLLEFLKVEAQKQAAFKKTIDGMTQTNEQMVTAFSTGLSSLSSALTTYAGVNKSIAKEAAAVALASAIVSGALAINNAFATQPFLPLGLAMGAMATVETGVQIATIASQAFSEGTDTVPSMLTPGEMVVPRSMADAIRAGSLTLGGPSQNHNGSSSNSGNGDINIALYGVTINSKENIRQLADELGFQIKRKLRGARSNL